MKLLFTLSFLLVFSATAFGQKISSVYTNLDGKSCKTLESSEEGAGWYRGRCVGTGGYQLEVTEGDLRQSVDVVAPNKEKFELSFGSVSSAFSSVGAKAEWRMKGKTPIALIVRFNASENPEDSSKITSYLIVTKITKGDICIVDVVKPTKTQNEEARKVADSSANKPCRVAE